MLEFLPTTVPGFSTLLQPVSYTHLDVYKRQIPAIVSEELWIAANRAADERLCRKKVGKSVQT